MWIPRKSWQPKHEILPLKTNCMGSLLIALFVVIVSVEPLVWVRVMVCLGKSSITNCTACASPLFWLVALNVRVQDCKRTKMFEVIVFVYLSLPSFQHLPPCFNELRSPFISNNPAWFFIYLFICCSHFGLVVPKVSESKTSAVYNSSWTMSIKASHMNTGFCARHVNSIAYSTVATHWWEIENSRRCACAAL